MKLGVAIASDNALPSAFVVMRGLEKSIKLALSQNAFILKESWILAMAAT